MGNRELAWWWIQFAVNLAGPKFVHFWAVVLLEHPWHSLVSGFLGASACGLMWFGLRRRLSGCSKWTYFRLLEFSTVSLCIAVGVAFSVSGHVWQDFGQDVIPASASSPFITYIPIVIGAEKELGTGVGAMTQFPYTCEDLELAGVDWFHDWSMNPGKGFDEECPIQPVCQCWGLGCFDKYLNPDCKILAMWNECSVAGQANCTPLQAAQRWPGAVAYAAQHNLKITTPCDKQEWLNGWADTYKAEFGAWPDYDYVCIHSYPAGPDVDDAIADFKRDVNSAFIWDAMHGKAGRVIVHEYGYWPAWSNAEDAARFAKAAREYLEERGIMGAWFALSHVGDYISPWHDTSLVKDGELTALGRAYRR